MADKPPSGWYPYRYGRRLGGVDPEDLLHSLIQLRRHEQDWRAQGLHQLRLQAADGRSQLQLRHGQGWAVVPHAGPRDWAAALLLRLRQRSSPWQGHCPLHGEPGTGCLRGCTVWLTLY